MSYGKVDKDFDFTKDYFALGARFYHTFEVIASFIFSD